VRGTHSTSTEIVALAPDAKRCTGHPEDDERRDATRDHRTRHRSSIA
jgi:hypothetical protein